MYGLEAISANNGWAMAIAGALIVISGLTVLAFVIAQLHKLIGLFEKLEQKQKQKKELLKKEAKDKQKAPSLDRCLSNIDETADLYQPLVEQLNDSFQLRELYEISRKNNFPHPHLTIRHLRSAGILVPKGDGIFYWSKQKE